MKVILLHDWLIHMRGGEKVLEALAEMYPDAVIYTLFSNPDKLSPSLRRMTLHNSWLHDLPGIRRYYRWLLPILPWVAQSIKLPPADLVISSSHCVIKAVPVPRSTPHLCYCHTPMRYAWGFEASYFDKFPGFLKPVLRFLLGGLRKWDAATASNVSGFIANSHNVARRIQDFYGREAEVVYPPLDSFYSPQDNLNLSQQGYYLIVSAFVPYKKVEIAIEAFNALDRPLLVVGSGPMEAKYREMRKSTKISFLGGVSNQELRNLYSGARALIFPTEEDFGIVPLEAQACGTPVIAYRKGGALESVKHGVFFDDQTPASLARAIENFEKKTWDRGQIAASVRRFVKDAFKQNFKEAADRILSSHVTG